MAAGEFFELPELINHRILSFLGSKEAARTTILSKPWRTAWLTRPDIDFDLNDFNQSWDSFLEFAHKTIRRYEISDLKIGSFSLRNVETRRFFGPSPIANLIVEALKLGANRLIFESKNWYPYFLLPKEVFASENLIELYLKGCKFDLGLNLNVGCSKLRSLTLEHVTIDSRVMFIRIISSCPLIEELTLSFMDAIDDGVVGDGGLIEKEVFASENLIELYLKGCKFDLGLNLNVGCSKLRSLTLEHVTIDSRVMFIRIISSCPLIEELTLSFMDAIDDGVVGDGGLIELRRLRSLVLDHTDSDTVFLNGLSSKFPSLKDLTLCMYVQKEAQEEILISSPSLVCLDLKIRRYARTGVDVEMCKMVKLDVPSICKLTFQGTLAESPPSRSDSMCGWGPDDVFVTHQHRECLCANNIDFLVETFLQGLNVRISSLNRLTYGLNLVEAKAQVFDKANWMWREVPLSDADSTIPEGNGNVRFQLIWQPKQTKA